MKSCFNTVILIFLFCSVSAQKENMHWMVGSYLGMSFNNGAKALPPLTAKMYASRGCASISDKKTGDLLFYTNGRKVFNRLHQMMPNGGNLSGVDFDAHDVIAVPFPGDDKKYYIFIVINTLPHTSNPDCNVFYAVLDMRLNGGLGDVVMSAKPIANWMDHYICVVKQQYENGYWLLTHKKGTSDFYAYSVNDDSVFVSKPRISTAGSPTYAENDFKYGNLVSDSKGSRLAHAFGKYQQTPPVTELFHFDKSCGTVTFENAVYPHITQFDPELAVAAFSPDDNMLYVGWNYLSQSMVVKIYQYDLSDPDMNANKEIIALIQRSPGDMKLAADGKIYCTMSENGNACAQLSVINEPNKKGIACNFVEKAIDLAPGFPSPTYFVEYLPNYMTDRSIPLPAYGKPQVTMTGSCLEEAAGFSVKGNFLSDSIRWSFGDNYEAKGIKDATHFYASAGSYNACFSWYLCGLEYKLCSTLNIGKKPLFSLGNDTTLCAGVKYQLNAESGGAKYLWSTGDTTAQILVSKAGKYSVKVSAGSCSVSKSVSIKYYPSIWTLLGDEHFICEKENELVKLDAGEGFPMYKWLPTGDTTQWIIVAQTGKYFVIVQDFRGCKGEDSTRVDERCPLRVFFPNAFSPNGDGHNDFFQPVSTGVSSYSISIYNRWGEQVFFSDDINKGWDGNIDDKPAPEGSYYFKARYSGFEGKRLRSKESSAVLTLLR